MYRCCPGPLCSQCSCRTLKDPWKEENNPWKGEKDPWKGEKDPWEEEKDPWEEEKDPDRQHAETRDRAGDLQIFSLTLSQLSYRGSALPPRLSKMPSDPEL